MADDENFFKAKKAFFNIFYIKFLLTLGGRQNFCQRIVKKKLASTHAFGNFWAIGF